MIAKQWENIKEQFENALNCPPEDRQSFLDRLALTDPAGASEVARLLCSFEKAGDFLIQPCCPAPDLLEELDSEQQRFFPGDVVCSRFHIIRLLGKGGMGEVYDAWDEEVEDHVALKTLRPEISALGVFASRFRRETQLARKVTHPNVCRIFDSFKHPLGDGAYVSVLSMELLQGQTLAAYLKVKGRLRKQDALPIVVQIIAGLSAIHAAGIIHRDLKPTNLVLVESPTVKTDVVSVQIKITDFGIAGQLPDSDSSGGQTEASKLLGTPDYMAPEQLDGANASICSDVYSLGLILYEMVTGVKPFAGTSPWKRISTDPLPAKNIVHELSDDWNRAIACCLERNPVYRFQNAQAVLDTIQGNASLTAIPRKPLFLRLKHSVKSRVGLAIAILLLTVSLSALFYRLYVWRPVLPEGTRVLFPEIQISRELLTSDETLGAVTDLVRNQLEDSPKLLLLNRRQIDDLSLQMAKEGKQSGQQEQEKGLNEHATLREMAWRGGASLFLLGTLSRTGNRYVFAIWAEEVGSEPNVELRHWEQSFTAKNKDGIFDAVQQGSYWVRRLAERLPESKLKKEALPQSTTTSSWQALLLFSQAEKLQAAGQKQQAIALLEDSTKVDPDFSLAYMRLGDLYDSVHDEKHGFFYWTRAFAALQLRPVTQKENLRINALFAQDSGDWKGSEEAFKTFETLYPYEYLPSFYLATTLANLNRPVEALVKDKQAEAKQPDAYSPIAQEARLELVLGQFTEAEDAVDRLRKMRRPDAANAIQVSLDMLREDFPDAFEALRRMEQSGDPLYESRGYSLHASLLSEMRKLPEAIKILKEGIAFDEANGLAFNEADKLLALAYLHLRRHAFSDCGTEALQAISKENGRLHLLKAGTLLARAGYPTAAKQVLYLLESEPDLPVFAEARHELQGEIFEAQGRLEEAYKELLLASNLDVPSRPREYLVRILEKMGKTQEALAFCGPIVEAPAAIWQLPEFHEPGLWADMEEKYIALDADSSDPVAVDSRARASRLRQFGLPAIH